MSRRLWPDDTAFESLVLTPVVRTCAWCNRYTHMCDHRRHSISTLNGPLAIVARLTHCPDRACPGHHITVSPEEELLITCPGWSIGWDVFSYVGHRRFSSAWSVPVIRAELFDRFQILLSEDAIEKHIRRSRGTPEKRHRP